MSLFLNDILTISLANASPRLLLHAARLVIPPASDGEAPPLVLEAPLPF